MRLFLSLFIFFAVLSVSAQQKDSCLTIPSSLSMANDEKLMIGCACDLAEFSIQLYSRWGELVYEAKSFMIPFDLDLHAKRGKKKHEVSVFNSGTYIYKIRYRKYNAQEYVEVTGYINVL